MGTVRMFKRGRVQSKAAGLYMKYKSDLAYLIDKQHKKGHLTGPLQVDLTFFMQLPKNSISQKRKVTYGDYVTTTPDADNLIKGVLDAANGIIFKDDSQVSKISAVKVYGEVPGIRMEVREI